MTRHNKSESQPPIAGPEQNLEQGPDAPLDGESDNFDQGVVFFDMEGYFDLDPEGQEARVRQMLEMLSPNPEVRARARKKAEGEETQ